MFEHEDALYDCFVAPHQQGLRVWLGASCMDIEYVDVTSATNQREVTEGSLLAPISGIVTQLKGASGDKVKAGDQLLIMEAMKMEHIIVSPRDGTIKNFLFAVGQQVKEGDLLVEIE